MEAGVWKHRVQRASWTLLIDKPDESASSSDCFADFADPTTGIIRIRIVKEDKWIRRGGLWQLQHARCVEDCEPSLNINSEVHVIKNKNRIYVDRDIGGV